MIWERQNQFLSKIPEMSNRLRLKSNQILMEFPSMLKLHYMLTPVSFHLMPTKLTRLIFSEDVKWKDRDDLLNWVRHQANRAGFAIVIQRSSLINPMLQLVCERSGDHKVPKKRSKHETTGSRKCGCMFMVRGYLCRQTNN